MTIAITHQKSVGSEVLKMETLLDLISGIAVFNGIIFGGIWILFMCNWAYTICGVCACIMILCRMMSAYGRRKRMAN